MTHFENIKQELTHGRNNANYKPKAICILLGSENFTATKENMAKGISSVNRKMPHPYFMTHNTVFDVLEKRLNLIEKIDKSYRLKGKFSPDQIRELKHLCKLRLEALK